FERVALGDDAGEGAPPQREVGDEQATAPVRLRSSTCARVRSSWLGCLCVLGFRYSESGSSLNANLRNLSGSPGASVRTLFRGFVKSVVWVLLIIEQPPIFVGFRRIAQVRPNVENVSKRPHAPKTYQAHTLQSADEPRNENATKKGRP